MSEKAIEPISKVTESLYKFLLEKNKRYGNSALEPIHVFSDLAPNHAIMVRIDDKLSRIRNSNSTTPRKNDVVDLLGYLILLCIVEGWTDFTDLLD